MSQPGPEPGREEMITMMIWYGGHWPFWQAHQILDQRLRDLLNSADQSPARSGSAR